MPSLWFVVPAAGRAQLARICLRQLRHVCDELTAHRIRASAVVIADDENLDTAHELGFATVERDNTFVSQKFNDGIQLACDRNINPKPADYVVPCGSDDWVDWRIFRDLPAPDTIRCFERMSFVREDGLEMTSRQLLNTAGCGIRIYPREVVAHYFFRPADEDRKRACDTSILVNLQKTYRAVKISYGNIDPRQIVDWKSPDAQLNPYGALRQHKSLGTSDPFQTLKGIYPDDLLALMADHYRQVRERTLAAA